MCPGEAAGQRLSMDERDFTLCPTMKKKFNKYNIIVDEPVGDVSLIQVDFHSLNIPNTLFFHS